MAADSPRARKRPRLEPLRVAIVGGGGRVGLPLALVLAETGHRVVVIDRDAAKLEAVRAGRFPFLEPGGPELLARCLAEFPDRLVLTADYEAARDCEVIVVTIGTPVDEHLNPRLELVTAIVDDLKPCLHSGQTLVLRSTLFPGTAERIGSLLRSAGLDVGTSVCPERVAKGRAVEELRRQPQIISGSNATALSHARALFAPLRVDLVELELKEAELAKLFLNSWRYVAFGTANQFYHIACSKGLDFDRIRAAIVHRYGRAGGFPNSGLTAGPRLFRDTMQLAAFCRHKFSLGHAAMLVNETMPDCVIDQARKELAKSGTSLSGKRCGVLGMAFKPDSDDPRESLAFKLRRLLLWEGAEVFCSDVHVQAEDFVSAEDLIARADVVFIGCPHEEYRHVKFRQGQKVFDCWGITEQPPLSITVAGRQADDTTVRGSLKVAVVGGAGHVGLPLSLVLAERGHSVVVVDMDAAKLEAIGRGEFPFLEAGGPELLKRCLREFPERLRLTTSSEAVSSCDVIIVTIGTPVDEHLNPCVSVVEACVQSLRPSLRAGQTLLLRSTLFPGTSGRMLAALRAGGLDGVGISFCPERIAQGYALEELTKLPQIISGSDEASLNHARALFAPLGVDLVELELQEAEAAKLFLNSWRYVIFGTANQFYHIAASHDLDFERIRAAIAHKYERAIGFPRSGFTAGPCLFKDTMQLAAYCRHTFSLGHAAMLVNETMPECVVELAKKQLALRSLSLEGSRVGILGMAFKPDSDDERESLAFKLRRLLCWEGAEVFCTDVYLRREGFCSVDSLVEQCDTIFVGCPHREYREIQFRKGQLVLDCWGSLTKAPIAVIAADNAELPR
eukprot:TRINITY_DN3496_c1_g1_i1.p1 TRINITY_DN3496_c1_g1~~TRINITY_DN3496_c1_g1_i1.p1  ORF type:complete len:865 (-),score=129.98 TRINITY_DN3496_c1_g1_i1:1-2541(-)